jgi:hypothetical protein
VTGEVDDGRSQADEKVLEAAQQTLGLAPWRFHADVKLLRSLRQSLDILAIGASRRNTDLHGPHAAILPCFDLPLRGCRRSLPP